MSTGLTDTVAAANHDRRARGRCHRQRSADGADGGLPRIGLNVRYWVSRLPAPRPLRAGAPEACSGATSALRGLARDVLDVGAIDADVVQFTVGVGGQLAHRVPIHATLTEITADGFRSSWLAPCFVVAGGGCEPVAGLSPLFVPSQDAPYIVRRRTKVNAASHHLCAKRMVGLRIRSRESQFCSVYQNLLPKHQRMGPRLVWSVM